MSVLPAALVFLAAPLPSISLEREPSIVSTSDVYPGEWQIERGPERWLCYRIVDDASGRPIANAELILVPEHKTPLAGSFWSTRSAKSDSDGFVRVRVDDIEGQWDMRVLRAKGHAISSRSKLGEPVWRVAAPQDVPVLVRDWRGEPVAGALIGFCGSCGHGPDLANATSDANGIAILRGIDPFNDIADVYCQARGLGLGYERIVWRPGDPPFELVCAYSKPLTGTLLDHAGNPVAGAFVGQPDVHRGPWAMTRADGSFEVLGAPSDSWLMARVAGREVHFPQFASVPVVLRLPAAPEEHEGTVDDPAPRQRVEREFASLEIRIEGGDEDTPAYASAPGFETTRSRGTRLDVPKSGPFAVRIGDRVLNFASLAEVLEQPLVLTDLPPTRVTATAVDPVGRAVPVRATLRFQSDEAAPEMHAEDGAISFEVRRTGRIELVLEPRARGLRARTLEVTLPARGEDVRVELGRIVLSVEPQLRVLAAEGSPRTDVRIRSCRAGRGPLGGESSAPLDETGGWTGTDLRAGDWIVVEPLPSAVDHGEAFAVRSRTLLSGEGPWVITPPTGVLDVEVRGIEDEAHVLIGDQLFDVGSKCTLVGLAPGSVTMWITAKDRRAAVVTATISASGPNAVTVELAPL